METATSDGWVLASRYDHMQAKKKSHCNMFQWPGHVQRCHTILGTHKVFEVHIQDEFRDENTPEMASFLWRLRKDAAAVHQLITDGEKRAHGVVCFDFKARPGVSGRDRVKFLLGLVSRTFGWAPSDTLVASGKLEASEAWCVLQVCSRTDSPVERRADATFSNKGASRVRHGPPRPPEHRGHVVFGRKYDTVFFAVGHPQPRSKRYLKSNLSRDFIRPHCHRSSKRPTITTFECFSHANCSSSMGVESGKHRHIAR